MTMTPIDKATLVAQWAFDTRPVLLRFHLWLEDVEVERAQAEPVSAHTFTPRGIARCLAMTSAATALGTRLFGDYGGGAGRDKATVNQVKKSADAVSAYVMSEGLWHLTRTLPENHALMVCLGEGLMPKAGESPEMGANPMLGFGRVYARPELARTVDRRVRRLLNEPGHTFEQFYGWLQSRGITLWGAAVDTLENTSRFADGKPTGPIAVFHLFASPLRLPRPYAPTFLVGSWKDGADATHVFLCDGYAATAEAMQAASLSDVLDVHSTMAMFSPSFELPCDAEARLMQLDPSAPDFAQRLAELAGGRQVEAGKVRTYAEAIEEAAASNMPRGKQVLQPDDFLPEK